MRRLLIFGAAALLCIAAVSVAPISVAHAATGRVGACTGADSNAVTVVIDYQVLGGTAVYCASNLSAGATGLDALAAVGVAFQGTSHDGLGFICRIGGRPTASETLTLPNGSSYVENCVNTPPASAYWTSWTASAGGSWAYSTLGAVSRSVVFGSYEGWSFALGAGIGNGPPPRVAPVVWEVPSAPQPPPPPPPEPEPQRPQPDTQGSHDDSGAGAGSGTDAQIPSSHSSAGESAPSSPSPSDLGSANNPGASAAGLPSVPATPSPTASPTPGSPSSVIPTQGLGGSEGSTWPMLVGLLLTVVLAGTAAGMAWFRKRKGQM